MILHALTKNCIVLNYFLKNTCLNNRPFVFAIMTIILILVAIAAKFQMKRNSFYKVLIACEVSNKSNKRLLRYWTLIFYMSCRIACVTSYLSENEAENLENGDVHLA